VKSRVARWYIFEPKIQIWVNFGGSFNGRCWYILWPFGQFLGHIPSIFLQPFGISYGHLLYTFPFWYVVPRKIWQPWWREKSLSSFFSDEIKYSVTFRPESVETFLRRKLCFITKAWKKKKEKNVECHCFKINFSPCQANEIVCADILHCKNAKKLEPSIFSLICCLLILALSQIA
jgi:hypothetical protein